MPGRIRDPGPKAIRAGLGQVHHDPPAPAQDGAGAGSAAGPGADGEPGSKPVGSPDSSSVDDAAEPGLT